MNFEVGDKVRILPHKKWYDGGSVDYLIKVGVVGEVVKNYNPMPLVEYEDGTTLHVLRHEIEKVEDFFGGDTGSF